MIDLKKLRVGQVIIHDKWFLWRIDQMNDTSIGVTCMGAVDQFHLYVGKIVKASFNESLFKESETYACQKHAYLTGRQ